MVIVFRLPTHANEAAELTLISEKPGVKVGRMGGGNAHAPLTQIDTIDLTRAEEEQILQAVRLVLTVSGRKVGHSLRPRSTDQPEVLAYSEGASCSQPR